MTVAAPKVDRWTRTPPAENKYAAEARGLADALRRRIQGEVRFSASTVAAALVEVDPGGMREMHWHPNTDEWQYYVSGHARMTVFASSEKARTFDYQAGDVGYVPCARLSKHKPIVVARS